MKKAAFLNTQKIGIVGKSKLFFPLPFWVAAFCVPVFYICGLEQLLFARKQFSGWGGLNCWLVQARRLQIATVLNHIITCESIWEIELNQCTESSVHLAECFQDTDY